ncbi:hypothetical protein BT69DRAFT_833573 [Atractiella rhizophila]|nr:hypothetical protein BT69DRAFT_833573 [Atractiella rhizophila]
MSKQFTNAAVVDKYFGRKDICLFAEKSVTCLFPLEGQSSKATDPSVAEWYAYLLYRTAIPNSYVFLALHLLRRISLAYVLDPSSPTPPNFYHSLLLSATILSSKYMMDDCFSNGSFHIASKRMFSVKEINNMEMSLLASLNWRIREEDEDLGLVLGTYEQEWAEKLAAEKMEKFQYDQRRQKVGRSGRRMSRAASGNNSRG